MSSPAKSNRPAGARRRPSALPPLAATSQARRQAAAILEVLAGMIRPAEAARVLEVSLPRYYLLERRALVALLAACEPAPRGPRLNPSRQIAALERENHRLRRECDRQQALVRAAERTLGLALPRTVKPSAKAKDQPQGSNGSPRRRLRRPTVRALKEARTLLSEIAEAASEGGQPSAPATLATVEA